MSARTSGMRKSSRRAKKRRFISTGIRACVGVVVKACVPWVGFGVVAQAFVPGIRACVVSGWVFLEEVVHVHRMRHCTGHTLPAGPFLRRGGATQTDPPPDRSRH